MALLPTAVSALSKYEIEHYSLSNLISRAAKREEAGRAALEASRFAAREDRAQVVPPKSLAAEGPEFELHTALEKQFGPPEHGGFYVPVRLRASGLGTKTDAGGGYAVNRGANGDIIDALIAQSKVLSLGATLMNGLNGGESFPREKNVTTASWVSENPQSDVAESDPSFESVTPRPKMLTATTSYSRKLLASSSVAVEQWLRTRLARAHALGLDAAAINGSGVSNQPVGLLSTDGVNIVPLGADGAVPDATNIHALVRAVGDANADSPQNAFLTSPKMRELLSMVARFTGAGTAVWNDDRMVGYRAAVSSNVPQVLVKGSSGAVCHAILFGDWSQLMVCEWGILEVVVDVFSSARRGQVEITSYQNCDVVVRQPAAFAAIVDAKVS